MDIYLKIARLYLEEQNHISAEAYINRAALLQSEVTNKELHIVYKVSMFNSKVGRRERGKVITFFFVHILSLVLKDRHLSSSAFFNFQRLGVP